MLRRKEEFINFRVKEKLILQIAGSKRSFSMQELGRKMIFPQYLRNLHDISRNEKDNISVLKKKQKKNITQNKKPKNKNKKNDKMIKSLA